MERKKKKMKTHGSMGERIVSKVVKK